MEVIRYLKAIKQRWYIVAITLVLALLVGWFVPRTVESQEVAPVYSASTLVVINGASENPGSNNIETLALIARTGEVPKRVAAAIQYPGDPNALASRVQTSVTTRMGTMTITATAESPDESAEIANAFAKELGSFLEDRREGGVLGREQLLRDRMNVLRQEVGVLDRQIAAASGSDRQILTEERDAKVRLYGSLFETYQRVANGLGQSGASLQIIRPAVSGHLVAHSANVLSPSNSLSQMAIAAGLGLIVGISIALVADQLDTRIRTKQEAEEHLRAPVLAQIPLISRRYRNTRRALSAKGTKTSADAYRLLAATIGRGNVGADADGSIENGFGKASPRTVLVTSPGPMEGKTTVVANLALAFAELGKRVLVVSCDFTRPRIHRMFGVGNRSGLSRALQRGMSPTSGVALLDGHIRATSFAGVAIVPSGPAPERSGELLSSPALARVLEEAKGVADVVLLDAPPVLVSDTAHLLPRVDAVLVVARAGKTTVQLAERAAELLDQFHAPVIGTALTGTGEIELPSKYYSMPGVAAKRRPARKVADPRAIRPRSTQRRPGTNDPAPSHVPDVYEQETTARPD